MKLVALKAPVDHKPRDTDFATVEAPRPKCAENGVIARVAYVSLDPYVGSRIRGRHMGEASPTPLKDAIPGAVVAQVEESNSKNFREGDWIYSMEGGWSEHVAIDASHCRKIDPDLTPLRSYIGVLGMPGLTAWAGVTQLAKVGKDDVFLVDAAAGAVGGVAGQLARLKGASRVVGIAGGPEKCALVVDEYGFDACVDYKKEGWRDSLKAALPAGLSVFFENVSADMAMVALMNAKPYARGVLCGLVDAYHTDKQSQHPLNAGLIIGKRAQILGLVVYDYYARWCDYIDEVAPWVRSGDLNISEDIAEGLDSAPALFEKLMDGRNIGKCIVRFSTES